MINAAVQSHWKIKSATKRDGSYYRIKNLNEEQLIKEIKRYPARFAIIYDEHYSTLFNYCLKRTGDFNSSKDIASETFLKAYLNIGKFKWKGIPIITWLYRIATNEINLHHRSKKYRPALLNETGVQELWGNSNPFQLNEEQAAAEKEMEKHAQFQRVQKVVKELPIHYQEVIALKYFENMKVKEISRVLNKPEGTIKSLLSRGIGLLKDRL